MNKNTELLYGTIWPVTDNDPTILKVHILNFKGQVNLFSIFTITPIREQDEADTTNVYSSSIRLLCIVCSRLIMHYIVGINISLFHGKIRSLKN